jgi:hypothetical protein
MLQQVKLMWEYVRGVSAMTAMGIRWRRVDDATSTPRGVTAVARIAGRFRTRGSPRVHLRLDSAVVAQTRVHSPCDQGVCRR